MDEGCQQRIEIAKGCHADANRIHQQGSDKILPDDAAGLARDADGFGELEQVIADEYNLCTFFGNIGARAHGNADGGCTEGRCVIDPVAHHGHGMLL